MKDIYSQVQSMHKGFQLEYNGAPRVLSEAEVKFRCACMMEELVEYMQSVFDDSEEYLLHRASMSIQAYLTASDLKEKPDLAEQFDALVDLAVFTLGTADRQGLPFNMGFTEVIKANMKKTLGPNARRGSFQNDLVKPNGWEAPDLTKLIQGDSP